MSDADSTLPAPPGTLPAALISGAKIGRFSTIGTLGSGGMGVVLEAHDPELDRRVAIKILHRGAGVVRLQKEAQAMAKLSHPNVVAVYDVGNLDEQVFVAMELVDGGTLRAWMREPHDWRQIVTMLLGVGKGLAAAHDAGLVHRDVKPENVLVGKDGRPRVTDFGLVAGATLAEDAVMGTPAYMAPEQWSGETVDARSDQFAFCVLAWEALTGARPYANVMTDETIEAPSGSAMPRALEQVLRKGLERDRAARWPDMHALLAALEAVVHPRRRAAWIVAGAVAFPAIAVAVGVVARGSGAAAAKPPSLDLVPNSITRLTFDDACDEYPSFSPDGKTIYYDSTRGPDVRLFAIDQGGGASRELAPTAGMDLAAKVSPDGTRIAFLRATEQLNMSLVVAPLGDLAAPKVFAVSGGRPFWSPDGNYVWTGLIDKTVRYDAATGAVNRTLEGTAGTFAVQGIELPDGRVVVLTFPLDFSTRGNAVTVYSPTGEPRTLYTEPMWDVLTLLPDGDAVAVANRNANHTIDLVRVPLDGSPPTILTRGTILARSHLALSGRRLVWSDCFSRLGLAKLDDRGATELGRSDWSDSAVAAAPGSRRYYFVSDRTGEPGVYTAELASHESVTRVPLASRSPGQIAISADARLIAFVERDVGLHVAPLDGSAPPRLLAKDTTDVFPAFDRHGTTIYFARFEGEMIHVMKVPVAGGEPVRVIDTKSHAPAPSPTEDVLAYLTPEDPGGSAPMLLDLRTGTSRKLFPPERRGRWDQLRWSADGKRILVGNTSLEIVEVEVATGRELRTWKTAPDMVSGLTYVGDDIVISRGHWTGDLWTATLAD